VRSFLTSTLLHGAVVFFLYSVPLGLLLYWLFGWPQQHPVMHPQMVVFELQPLKLEDYLPAINPPGKGKAPGRGAKHGPRPRLGATHYDPRVTLISNPPHPDNSRVTLHTENAPPALKLPKDLRLPDLISGGPGAIPEPGKLAPPAAEKTPPPAEQTHAAPPPPPPAPKPPQPEIVAPSVKLVLPSPPPPPVQLAMQLPNIPSPRLEVPPPSAPAPPAPAKAVAPSAPAAPAAPQETTRASDNSSSTAAAAGQNEKGVASGAQGAGGGPKIMALSVDPVPFKDLSQIPAGVLNGSFSIGPAGALGPGSPGGVPGGPPDVGEGGHGPGGDSSVAVGKGDGSPGGGGGGGSGAPGAPAVSVSGFGGAAGAHGLATLSPLKPEDLVYAVKPETPKAHAPSLVVSTGSYGGGGLRMYGVLHGDRIYTVYFSMPGTNWILQYCVHESTHPAVPASGVVQIHMQPPLVPPAAIDQFDFHRPADEHSSAHDLIILHGFIQEDGTVSDLSVVQSGDALNDAAARAAFSRWKFKPALRAGVPVALEILVGILP
jgi:hypothetical protein